MSKSYFANELSFEGQFGGTGVREMEREMAILSGIHSFLNEKGLSFYLSRAILGQPVSMDKDGVTVLATVENVLEKIEYGISSFFWEWIGSWPHARVEDDFGVRVFFSGREVTSFGIARPAVHCYLGESDVQRLFSLASSTTCAASHLTFEVVENENAAAHSANVANLTTKDALIVDLGGIRAAPRNWNEAVALYEEKYQYVSFTSDLKAELRLAPWNAALSSSLDEKMSRLDEIAGAAIELRRARERGGDACAAELSNRYNEIYQKLFARKHSTFCDESDSNKDNKTYKTRMTFTVSPGRTEFCPFHGRFDYDAHRVHFTWPISERDDCVYVTYLGRKLTMD